MPYGETKVYFDGSHYIAIPHTEKPYKRRPKKIEEVITVADDGKTLAPVEEKAESPPIEEKQITLEDLAVETQETAEENTSPPKPIKTVKTTKKQVFDKFYADSLNLPKTARKRFIIEGMRSFFKSTEATENYVTLNMERKYKNLVARRVRLVASLTLGIIKVFSDNFSRLLRLLTVLQRQRRKAKNRSGIFIVMSIEKTVIRSFIASTCF